MKTHDSAELPTNLQEGIVFANDPAYPELGIRVAKRLGLTVADYEERRFSDTNLYGRYDDSVRDKLVIAFQTHAPNPTIPDSLIRHVHMIGAAAQSGAASVLAVAPNLAGSRQDKQDLPHEAISAELYLRMLRVSGTDHLVTVDIHDQRTLSAFRNFGLSMGRADNLTAQQELRKHVAEIFNNSQGNSFLVSPDEGHTKRLRKHAEELGVKIVNMVKYRDPNREEITHQTADIGQVSGADCVIMDDILGTGSTAVSAANRLHDAGAAHVYFAATHGHFSDGAVESINESPIEMVMVTDTIPMRDDVQTALGAKLKVIRTDELIATGLHHVITGKSLSSYYQAENYLR